ncbi:hypothetical protein A7U60_g6374 [Sanghuangporus baumii]|uniref:Uncharacterized protein n=1 Tax=Sanghuangporus baumii TaxID=108892 RepID=A0A9Q5HV38_SANBA|nr:hypothetical protein A7U60_g6374 [Sanghuangporus baumii]
MAQMPSTSGAGPSSNPISRTTSTSSHVSSDDPVSDSEEEWLGPFRTELKLQQDQRRRELLEGVEAKYRAQAASLAAKYSRTGASAGGLPDAAYQAAKAQLDRYYEQQKQKVQHVLDEEALALIEHERGIRKLSMGGPIDPNEATQLIQEQEELLKRFQAQRLESTNVSSNEKKPQPSTSLQTARWPVPPARPISSQKSNTSQASSVTRDRRGSGVVSQPKPNLTDDLFSKRSQPSQQQQSSRSARYAPWGDEFPSSFGIHEEPDEMPESDSSSGDEEDGRDTDEREGENSESEGESDDSQDGISILGDFMYSAEHNFVRTAPVDIVRGGAGAHQPSTRGRSRTAGRTPPVMSNPYSSATTTPLRQPHKETSKNSDTDHRLWKPSRENIRQTPLNRRPSFIDSSLREESTQEMQSRSGYQHIRAQQASGISRGAPGTSASPPTQGMPSTSFGASSAAAFSQQRQTEARPQIWRPPESRSSVPVLSNEHVTVSSTRNTGWATPTTSPTASVHSSRKRNDSDTSTGSPARRPSQSHSQSFTQPSPIPKASLAVNTPGLSAARRSPIPASDSYVSAPSPPISSPLSTSINRRSPLPPRTSSPPPLPISIGGSSLSRQPTEIIDPSPPSEIRKASKSYSRASAKSLTSGDLPEAELSFGSSASGSFNERMRGSPSTSALSERLARQREQDLEADRKQKEREEALEREAEELRQRDILHRKREAELAVGSRKNGDDATEQERQKREQVLQEQRAEQEKENRALREELEAAKLARDAAFEEQKSILVQQRQREADRRRSLEHDLAAKEEELSRHKREMEEWKRRRQEDEIAERTRQLEILKRKEATLEQQQKLLEEEREREVSAQRRRIEELNMKVEELKRKTQELAEEQQRREEKRREEEERHAEQRRKEEQLRAEEEALKQKEWQIHRREEELARRKKEDELRAKEEALARQRRELQAREEELARREEEDARRRMEEQMQKEKELILRRQREDEDRKRNEERVMRKLTQEREREEQKEAQLREMREREEIEREMREKERERLMQEDDRQRQFRLKAEEMERRRREEQDRLTAEEIKEQEELLRFYEQRKQTEEARKRGPQRTGSTSSYSSSFPAASSSYSAAFGAFPSGRATSSASSVHSSASQRSSASSASASSAAPTDYSHYSHASTASSASSASTRPTAASTGSSTSSRTATGESRKPRAVPKAETYGGARTYGASGTSPSSAGPRTGPTSGSIPSSEEEVRRRQEEYIREQQRRFEQQKLHEERERAARAAGDATAQVVERWTTYDREWNELSEKPVLFFHSIPWPLLKQPTGDVHLRKEGDSVIEEAQVTALVTHPTLLKHLNLSVRDLAKQLLRRYHSDRFVNGVLSRVPDGHKAAVEKAANDVASALNKIKDGSLLF